MLVILLFFAKKPTFFIFLVMQKADFVEKRAIVGYFSGFCKETNKKANFVGFFQSNYKIDNIRT